MMRQILAGNATAGYIAPFIAFVAIMAAEHTFLPNSQILYPIRFAVTLAAILLSFPGGTSIGSGIGASFLEADSKPGHFGLLGMRERTKKMGGDLQIWSKPGAGTEIDLSVPAHIAYRHSKTTSDRMRGHMSSSP